MTIHKTPVLIVGAGLGGLSTALFLGLHGVPALAVERHPGTATQPKARGQGPTVMEGLRVAGVMDRILAATPPGRPEMTIVIAESVAGRVLHNFTEEFPDFSRFSPASWGMASQQRAEEALAARAAELGADLRFSTRMESFAQDQDGVSAMLRDLDTGLEYPVRAEYLVAADGHRGTIAPAAGIGFHGRGSFDSTTTVLFEADLDGVIDDAAVLMYYLQNPALPGGSGAFVSTDTPGQYVAGMQPDPGRDDAATVALIRTITGVADLAVKLLGAGTWEIAHRVADRFSTGRVHLVGDAAHLMPPTGGQGGGTAMLDGLHLAWKLAAVLRGQAGPGLLASHDAERRPHCEAIAEWQFANMVQRMAPHLADDTVRRPMDPVALAFGYRCPAGAFVPEPDPDGDPTLFEDPAQPTGRPGTAAPHVPLVRGDQDVSTRDLFGRDFVVLTGSAAWADATADVAARLGVPITAHLIGDPAGLIDRDGRWAAGYGVGSTGAVLIRPDGIIAWRSAAAGGPSALEQALRTVLDR